MLEIVLNPVESWDENKEEFVDTFEGATLHLEHSLVSLSKWESKWCRPFLHKGPASEDEVIDYIKCMTLDSNIDNSVYEYLSTDNIEQIKSYINAPMTATTFAHVTKKVSASRELVTSELIYYWMTTLHIPMECQEWHLNRLLTFVQLCNIKSQPPKKMSKREIMSRNAALNAARRKQYNTSG